MARIRNQRYRIYQRAGRVYYLFDKLSGKRQSLDTSDDDDALRLLHARNEAERQPLINRQIARAYLAARDPEITRRTWQGVMEEIVKLKCGETQQRWLRATQDHAFDLIRDVAVVETEPNHFLRALERGGVATNVFLRRIHNFALDLGWLPWPVLPKRQWPKLEYGAKRAITREEHRQILDCEQNPEKKEFYELCWFLGGSQGDIAGLNAEDIDWDERVVSYRRKKTKTVALLHFGAQVAALLHRLPRAGPLFPNLRSLRPSDRAAEFKRCCRGLEINGVTLHSYRYAWAERAKQCGYPERFAQEALGHNSQAVHRAYARKAQMDLPSLEEFEEEARRKSARPLKARRRRQSSTGHDHQRPPL